MSGPPPISGRMSRLKPWHYAVIGGTAALCISLIPALSRLTERKKATDTTAAMLAASATKPGEPWHPPPFPAPEAAPATYRPTVTAAPVTAPTSQPLVATAPAVTVTASAGVAD